MSILVNRSTRVLIQGITGGLGQSETAKMLQYGTRVVAGVTPGKGGAEVLGVPVYDTVADALQHHMVDAVMSYVPARICRTAAAEVIAAGIPLLAIAAELIPLHDVAWILAMARVHGTRVLGPNTLGVASPGEAILGGIGGDRPEQVLRPGAVGVISSSGGMGVEICWTLTKAGIGQSTFVSTGGEAVVGTKLRDLLALYQQDPATRAVVIFGEAGSQFEEDAADFIRAGGYTKPAYAIIAGRFTEHLPGVRFGHGRSLIEGGRGLPSVKMQTLAAAGVHVLRRLSDLPLALAGVAASAG